MGRYELPEQADVRPVRMDPAIANTVGMHHRIPTALADLVDNSIDAGATQIRVRFLLHGTTAVGLQVIDDGCGMDAERLDRALTYADGEHSDGDLGHFGVGLKAASLSQADLVLVCSLAHGATPVGRQLNRTGERTPPTVGTIDSDDAAARLAMAGITQTSGTLIEWRNPRTFSNSSDQEEKNRWLSTTVEEIHAELGLVFHRLLDRVQLRIDTVEVADGGRGPGRTVAPIDPFGYPRSGVPGYPCDLIVTVPDGSSPVRAEAHIWPAKSDSPSFRLKGETVDSGQGLFVYRNDRLLQAGGWFGIRQARQAWDLARVKVDLLPASIGHVTINPEKSGVTFSSDLRRAIEQATSPDGSVTLSSFLDAAAGVEQEARSRRRRPIEIVAPGVGMSPSLILAFEEAVTFKHGEDPVTIGWSTLLPEKVFEIDRDRRRLNLNLRYRDVIVGRHSLNPNDAPLLKALVYLLLNKYFEGGHLGAREKREIEAWQEILLAAVKEQGSTSAE